MIIHISVKNRVATYLRTEEAPVCGNSTDQVKFLFDEEWSAHEQRTARFFWGNQYHEETFTGDTCPLPMFMQTNRIQIGVYAGLPIDGEISLATTKATVPYLTSVHCTDAQPNDITAAGYLNDAKVAAWEAGSFAKQAKDSADQAQASFDQINLVIENVTNMANYALEEASAANAESADAKRRSENALKNANEANRTSQDAKSNADGANELANLAMTAVNDAMTAANDAMTAANDAMTAANDAMGAANDAMGAAGGAKTAADEAKALALLPSGLKEVGNLQLEVTCTVSEGLTPYYRIGGRQIDGGGGLYLEGFNNGAEVPNPPSWGQSVLALAECKLVKLRLDLHSDFVYDFRYLRVYETVFGGEAHISDTSVDTAKASFWQLMDDAPLFEMPRIVVYNGSNTTAVGTKGGKFLQMSEPFLRALRENDYHKNSGNITGGMAYTCGTLTITGYN